MRGFVFRVPLTSCVSPLEFPIAAILIYFLLLKCINERFAEQVPEQFARMRVDLGLSL